MISVNIENYGIPREQFQKRILKFARLAHHIVAVACAPAAADGSQLASLENFLKGKKHVHFIGIGGSGMYPLAQILHTQGYYLTGSDNNETTTLEAVRSMGIPVMVGQRAEIRLSAYAPPQKLYAFLPVFMNIPP